MTKPEERVMLAALAGLLHDVGKVAQRAGVRGSQERREVEQDFGYYHALLTADTLAEWVPAPWGEAVSRAAGYHHRPQDDLDQWVRLADHLSAGEREDEEDNRVPYLESLFSRIYGAGEMGYFPLQPLQPESEFIYPYERTAQWQADHQGEYENLWAAFEADASSLKQAPTLPALLEATLSLMQLYTWCVPSAYYRNVPDVSLYDHGRMTGALAACLAADERDGNWCAEVQAALYTEEAAAARPVAQLVGGDISGIQTYLYTMASGGAAKSLRGRSFYLQLLTEAVALAFLEALDLPITNLIYAGGGHFYILAPTNPQVARTVRELQQRLGEVLLRGHQGRLYLAVAHIAIPAHRFMGGAFSGVWDELKRGLERDKRRRFAALGAERMAEEIGAALGQGGHPDHFCQVCGREGDWTAEPDELRKCPVCESLEALGNDLRTTQALLVSKIPPEEKPLMSWDDGLRALGVDVTLVQEGQACVQAPEAAEFVRLWKLRAGPMPDVEARVPVVESRHLLALVAPRIKRKREVQVATFEDLAKASQTNVEQWGVLRMDVDDLGRLFREGLAERATLSRTAALSFLIRLFFEGHLPALVKPYNDFTRTGAGQDKAYVMYAGGDDLFIVGTWEVLPELAHAIQQKFGDFTADNPRITLSAGITVHPQKYPLYLAAEEAGEALEENAKGFRRPDGRAKDALSFLGQTIGWEAYPALAAQVERWGKWVEDGVASKGDLQLLRRAAALYRAERRRAVRAGEIREDQRYLGPWAWHMVYALSRRRERAKDRDYIEALNVLEDALIKGNAIRTVGLMARWAELLTRGGSKEDNDES